MLQAHHINGESMAEAEIARFFSAPTFLSTSARCGEQAERQAYMIWSRVRMTEGNYANVGMGMAFAKEAWRGLFTCRTFVHKCFMEWGLHSTEKTNLIFVIFICDFSWLVQARRRTRREQRLTRKST